jgi:hypothetical protein
MRLRIGIGMTRMNILCHMLSFLSSYIIYGNALVLRFYDGENSSGTPAMQAWDLVPALPFFTLRSECFQQFRGISFSLEGSSETTKHRALGQSLISWFVNCPE